MNLEQALSLIDQVLAQYRGSREDHRLMIEALQVVQGALQKAAPPPPASECSDNQ